MDCTNELKEQTANWREQFDENTPRKIDLYA